MYKFFNPNPSGLFVGDCVIRAICAVTGQGWSEVYESLAICGMKMCDMPTANRVWGAMLSGLGYRRHEIPQTTGCVYDLSDCYTVNRFCRDHPEGKYILATGTHVIAVINGDYYDTWTSGAEIPYYYWSEDK